MGTSPPDPPPPDWDATGGSSIEFNNAQSDAVKYGWDSTDLAIFDSSGTPNYLCVGKSATAGHVAWFYRTAANSGGCVYAKIPQATFNVIKGGSLNTQNGQISYGGHVYQLLLERDATTGDVIAYAFQIS